MLLEYVAHPFHSINSDGALGVNNRTWSTQFHQASKLPLSTLESKKENTINAEIQYSPPNPVPFEITFVKVEREEFIVESCEITAKWHSPKILVYSQNTIL